MYLGGNSENQNRITGRVVKASDPSDFIATLRRKKGEILFCPNLNEDWISILRIVDGVITTGKNELTSEMIHLANPNLVWISEIGIAEKSIENGRTVTIDGNDLLVYEGMI